MNGASQASPAWFEKHLYEPGGTVGQIAGWQERLDAIVARTHGADITLLAGTPASSVVLARASG